jgi:radical SAM/Cys-rich protein
VSPIVPLTVNGNSVFDELVAEAAGGPLNGLSIDTVQVNVGLACNMACHHCHVESSPSRTEQMDWDTMQAVLDAARRAGAITLDITGGAPEMHPDFRRFVQAARTQGLHVIVRTNLTILNEPGHEDLPAFFASQQLHLVASLPCYLEENVDKQRGKRAYSGSIEALRKLNAVGYGGEDDLRLDLVYNPVGPGLPPDQAGLEVAYRKELRRRFELDFTHLLTITNLPIGRFLHDLERDGRAATYWSLLEENFNPQTLDGLMCRHQLHVGHDGRLYDCDFNYALDLPATAQSGVHVRDFNPDQFRRRQIETGRHCLGCTAGAGSSCGGALT